MRSLMKYLKDLVVGSGQERIVELCEGGDRFRGKLYQLGLEADTRG